MKTPKRTLDLVKGYRKSAEALEQLKANQFRLGTAVFVKCDRYVGPGTAVTDGTCWPDHVAVALPHGHTRRYEIEFVQPISKQ